MKRVFLTVLLGSILVSVSLFLINPEGLQKEMFFWQPFWDYYQCIEPCAHSSNPYSVSGKLPFQMCYPPVSYLLMKPFPSADGALEKTWIFVSLAIVAAGGLWLFIVQRCRSICLQEAILVMVCAISSVLFLSGPAHGNPISWAAGCIAVFLAWYDSPSKAKRILAAVALAVAAALKITPCLFGIVYITPQPFSLKTWRWRAALFSAVLAALLVFIPFFGLDGLSSVKLWFGNASYDMAFHSRYNPTWGFVNLINRFAREYSLSLINIGVVMTRALAGVCLFLALCTLSRWRQLLFLGASMMLLTHHEYGGIYILPGFSLWYASDEREETGRLAQLLVCISWILLLTPLQIPGPKPNSSLTPALENEALFMLIVLVSIQEWKAQQSRISGCLATVEGWFQRTLNQMHS